MIYIYLYFLLMGLIGFIQMGIDKSRARHHRWRIQETTLLLTAFLGASFGSLLGMYIFHHKTRHRLFTVGIPAIIAFHLICLYFAGLVF